MSERSWDGVLEDGEEILWQGRPASSLHLKRILQVVLGPLILGIFAVVFFREQLGILLSDLGGSLSGAMDSRDLPV